MGMYKRAAVRGVAHELVRQGVVSFPSKEAMDEAADAVADGPPMEAAPEVSGEGGHSPEELAEAANKLIEIAHALMAEAQGGAGGDPMGGAGGDPMAAMAAKQAAEELIKQAGESDFETVASETALAVMEKAAAEVKYASALIGAGGEGKGNALADAAKNDPVAEVDDKARPQGTYQVARGDTALDTEGGAIGDLKKHDKQPGTTVAGSNSVSKEAALQERLRKLASSLIGVGGEGHGNSLTDAAKHDPVAELDKKNRPEGYAHVGQGNANFSEPQSSRVGTEQPHPHAPYNTPGGTNSVIQASKAAEEKQAAYVSLFEDTARDVGGYIPAHLGTDEKVAAIRHMMGMEHPEREAYLQGLHQTGGAVAAAGEKSGALLDRVRDIATRATAASA